MLLFIRHITKFLHTDVNIYHTNGYRHYWKPDYTCNTFERIKTWRICFLCNTIRWAVIHNIVQHDIWVISKSQYKKGWLQRMMKFRKYDFIKLITCFQESTRVHKSTCFYMLCCTCMYYFYCLLQLFISCSTSTESSNNPISDQHKI